MVTLADLGILRDVRRTTAVVVTITPTYSGCPALTEMPGDLHGALTDAGVGPVDGADGAGARLDHRLDHRGGPPQARRRRDRAAGTGPPRPGAADPARRGHRWPSEVRCPQCGSADTELTAAFSATACKALRRCRACREPFEHVKEI